ncbi:histone-lysine N-methyltransferase 2A [Grus japonensis]|uniref:Histone-lysine N-methyltransferase 2A n=1 Tax=Grus japonensis TaxID=30415 RepID=A0ABC9XRT3_GRUJA
MGDSSEDEEGGGGTTRGGTRGRYYRFARTVVTREPSSPCPLPLSHIDQLDGVDDGGDKGQRGQRDGPPPGPPLRPPAAEDLPSDIVDFVLKNMTGDGTKVTVTQASGMGVNGDGGGGTPWVTEGSNRHPGGARLSQDGHRGGPRGGGDVRVGDGDGANADGAHRHVGGGLVARGDATHGDVTHGNVFDGHGARGDATHGDGTHKHVGGGLVARGDATRGDVTHGNVLDGHGARGDATRGDVTHGNVLDGHGARGNATRGHVIGGPATRGHVTDGHLAPGGATNGHATLGDAAHHNGTHDLSDSTHGRVTRLSASRHGVTPGEVGGRWVSPWGVTGAPKRPGETPGPGAKRARLEVTGDEGDGTEDNQATRPGRISVPLPPLRDVLDIKEEPDDLSDGGSFGSPPGPSPSPACSPPPTDGTLEPPWAACAGDSSEDESPPPPPPPSPPARPHLRFEISSEDGLSVTADTIEGAWRAVTEKVQEARANARLGHLNLAGMSGLRLLGVQHDAVVFLVEQLPGAGACGRYRFRYHPRRDPPHPPPRNPSGCARAELYLRKCTFDMFSFLASQHRTLPQGPPPREEEEDEVQLKPTRRATSLELPMAMRFRHLKRTAKEAVGVYRSAIHGRGLFCKRNIEAGEMVIEYSGIVVRSVLTDKREKFYDSKGIGCYMFRIDDAEVVDATMHGSAARFINHSCEPNCYSRVIHVEGHKHIVIFALRRILRGEELTYDYKFPIEEPAAKLPCNCGAKRCRRYLN